MTIRIGCIGVGNWGRNLARSFDALGVLEWICERDAERRAELARLYPNARVTNAVDDVLADPAVSAVAIATPAETHGTLVREALLAGKDVFVEKPLCLSVREGEALVALAAEQGRVLMVGHLLWYHPAILKLKSLIDNGELGRIQYIYSNRLNLGRIRREENILWSFAPHDISVLLGLVGEMPNEVVAQGGNYLHERIADVTVTMLAFPSGVRAHIFVSWLHPFKEQKLVVVGDRKMAVFDDVEPINKLILYPHAITWRGMVPVASKAGSEIVEFASDEPLLAECRHFVECLTTRRTPRTDGHEALRVLRVLEQSQHRLDGAARQVSVDWSNAEPDTREYTAHETACIDDGVEIGAGTTIWHFTHVLKGSRLGSNCRVGQNVVIGPNVSVGDGVKIQNNVSVYEGVTLEDYVFCGPSMVFTNVSNPRSEIVRKDEYKKTLVRRGATLGANCTIVCGTTIGSYAFVGAGSVVIKDVPDYALVVGNPGRIIGWMCACGHRINFDEPDGRGSCEVCATSYSKAGHQVRLTEESAIPAD